MLYKNRINSIYNDLLEHKIQMEEELKQLPEGFLNIRYFKGKPYYTWQIPATGRRRKLFRKGISNDDEQINKLARKRYLSAAINIINKDISVLRRALDNYREIDEKALMEEYVSKYPEISEKLRYGNTSNDEWTSEYKMPIDFYKEGLKSTSARGSLMRSKGEIIIASRLDFYKVPYRYEAPIEHPDIYRVPDFTIKRPRDNKIIYWEHLGMVNNKDYMRENMRKLSEYDDVGVKPWNNLILTYDQEDGGIDVRIIDGLIQGWLM
jgi:hypothetical protein